jgi:hypothetical protein
MTEPYHLSRDELLGAIATFTDEQRRAREIFVELGLALPRDWLREEKNLDGAPLDATAEGRVATAIYSTLVDSAGGDPRFRDWDTWQVASSFGDVIRSGGDAYLWALIRIAIAELEDEDFVKLCENRGFIVRPPRPKAGTII